MIKLTLNKPTVKSDYLNNFILRQTRMFAHVGMAIIFILINLTSILLFTFTFVQLWLITIPHYIGNVIHTHIM